MSGGASFYIRGHLLNEHLGGMGTWKNLTPLSREGNHQHESQVESLVKSAVDSGAVVEYSVEAVPASRGDGEGLIARLPDDDQKATKAEIIRAEDAVAQGIPGRRVGLASVALATDRSKICHLSAAPRCRYTQRRRKLNGCYQRRKERCFYAGRRREKR